jgi:type II secretory pathway pseudopilin PulG
MNTGQRSYRLTWGAPVSGAAACGVNNERGGWPGVAAAGAAAFRAGERAFTMIEIAISLAIIGFALVAIIGVLPRGMNAQKENREDTIIANDSRLLLEAIRGGAQGMDYLTNYVVSITNHMTMCDRFGNPLAGREQTHWYTYHGSSAAPWCRLTNGYNIIGLISTPRYMPDELQPRGNDFCSNYVVVTMRSISGPAADKVPQDNQTMLDAAFMYRVYPEITAYSGYDTNSTGLVPAITNLQANLRDLRLRVRWPFVPGMKLGKRVEVFRTMVGGELQAAGATNLNYDSIWSGTNRFFFQSRTYVKAP